MAKIEFGILGPFRGKVGNVIGYTRNGVFCMRAMPTHYHDRRSAAQMKNRNRFTMVMKVMSAVRPAITLGFGRFANGMTEMNVATRVNYHTLVKEGGAGLVYSFGGLTLSQGIVEGLGGVMMVKTGAGYELIWDARSIAGRGGEDDAVSVVMVDERKLRVKMLRCAGRRRDGRVAVGLPSGWIGAETHCYVMVERGGEWSESEYVGAMNSGRMRTGSETAPENGGIGMETIGDKTLLQLNTGEREDSVSSDQSAIKVLSDSGQSREEKEVETPPGGGE